MKFKNILYFLFIFLLGCQKKAPMKGNKEIVVRTHKKINNRIALRMYIVQIYTKDAYEAIKDLDTSSFFEKKKQLLLDFPYGIKIWERDLLSDNSPKCFIVPANKRYWGLAIFFQYTDLSESKIFFPVREKTLIIKLENGEFEIEPITKRQVISMDEVIKKKFTEQLYIDENITK